MYDYELLLSNTQEKILGLRAQVSNLYLVYALTPNQSVGYEMEYFEI